MRGFFSDRHTYHIYYHSGDLANSGDDGFPGIGDEIGGFDDGGDCFFGSNGGIFWNRNDIFTSFDFLLLS
ncbi:hypothetical protein [Dolichospermum sp. UHCC 0259]|uniref:hypothetical protein n=1 Tax=Dolichospermum sp. UHCC 0259 TaxID=2590010 RepID=UPI0014455E8F|nr:hypothetical protein [Dolichospermum sp. UHCC 0259]MTJ50964.1 hypothetical protein [Dolichospermum sp. UHCC 0259]